MRVYVVDTRVAVSVPDGEMPSARDSVHRALAMLADPEVDLQLTVEALEDGVPQARYFYRRQNGTVWP